MSNLDRYNKVFIECFSVSPDQLNSEFVYQGIAAWDSIGHMSLISLLENEFDVMIEMDDVIDFGSYTIGIDILKKYDVEI
jgi:acyl carrier protein